MGDYNSYSFESTVSLDTEKDGDYFESGKPFFNDVVDTINDLLVESLVEEVNQARLSPNQKSAIQILLAKRKVA